MSTNCMKCGVNKRTGSDLLCDGCRPPSIPQQIAELEAAGWKQARVRTLWRSPTGSLHLGPHGAWKTMKANRKAGS